MAVTAPGHRPGIHLVSASIRGYLFGYRQVSIQSSHWQSREESLLLVAASSIAHWLQIETNEGRRLLMRFKSSKVTGT